MGKGATREEDTAARTLGEALAPGAAGWPPVHGRVLFLHAHAATARLAPDSRAWTCVQGLRPRSAELEAWGCSVHAEARDAGAGPFDAALALPPRQRDLARACLARAVASVRPGGMLRMAVTNLEGARSVERDLRDLIATVDSRPRNKCRVFCGSVQASAVDRDLLETWLALDEPREILDGRFVSRPGLFAWDRVDAASALLAAHLPADLGGSVADLGAGYGYLAVEALRRNPGIRALTLYEADARALGPARENLTRALAASGRALELDVIWHDVTRGLPRHHDAVICNPPFHEGRADRPRLGQAFIASAAKALPAGGQLWMVANRHLPYEATLAGHFTAVRTVVERDGFKVLHALRGSTPA